jgi:hypothetical protein
MNWLQFLIVLLYFMLFGLISWHTRPNQHKEYPYSDTFKTVSFIFSTVMLLSPWAITIGWALGNTVKIWTWLGRF